MDMNIRHIIINNRGINKREIKDEVKEKIRRRNDIQIGYDKITY